MFFAPGAKFFTPAQIFLLFLLAFARIF